MNGYQVTFFTQQDRRHGHQPINEWLMDLAKSLGIAGSTSTLGVEGMGRSGKLHSAKFFEFADQPIEITMIVTEPQAAQLFDRLEAEAAELFYVKTAVEYGSIGAGNRKP